jgi:hypothetical protein
MARNRSGGAFGGAVCLTAACAGCIASAGDRLATASRTAQRLWSFLSAYPLHQIIGNRHAIVYQCLAHQRSDERTARNKTDRYRYRLTYRLIGKQRRENPWSVR